MFAEDVCFECCNVISFVVLHVTSRYQGLRAQHKILLVDQRPVHRATSLLLTHISPHLWLTSTCQEKCLRDLMAKSTATKQRGLFLLESPEALPVARSLDRFFSLFYNFIYKCTFHLISL